MSLKRSLPALCAVAVLAAASTLLIANQNDSPSDEPPAASAASAPGPSGEAAPTADLTGWRQIFLDDFTQDVASWGDCDSDLPEAARTCSGLPEPYRSRWWAYPAHYPDTRENQDGNGGFYESSNLSMADGMLRLRLRRENGTTQGAAPIPKIGARTYGRYATRFKADPAPGFKVAWLLWPESESGVDDGEINFPEGDLDGPICAFMHFAPASPGTQDTFCTTTSFGSGWHTAVFEWTPGKVQFWLDDRLIGTSTTRVPRTPMTWILQSETSLTEDPPAEGAVATISVDWVAAWTPV